MNQLGAHSHSPIQHLPHERLDLQTLMVIQPDEQLKQIQRIPSRTLDIRSERLDGRTGSSHIVHRHDPPTGEVNKAECICGERKEGINEAELV